MRLGFAIAIDVNPDILIIDEILAVGDASFQEKCLDKIKEFKDQGKTIILVSHSHDMIKEFCSRAVWLKKGEKIVDDSSEKTVTEYLDYLHNKSEHKLGVRLVEDDPQEKKSEKDKINVAAN